MKRPGLGIDDVATFETLFAAFLRAGRGKRNRDDVCAFERRLERNLSALARQLCGGTYVPGPLRQFTIHDPKRRTIRAPAFRDRVVHHALMAGCGSVLDRALIDDSFACRVGSRSLRSFSMVGDERLRFAGGAGIAWQDGAGSAPTAMV